MRWMKYYWIRLKFQLYIYFIFAFIYLPPDNMFRSKENTSVVTAFIKSAQ